MTIAIDVGTSVEEKVMMYLMYCDTNITVVKSLSHITSLQILSLTSILQQSLFRTFRVFTRDTHASINFELSYTVNEL